MSLKREITNIAKDAQEASRFMLGVSATKKNKILKEMASVLASNKRSIVRANKKDIRQARGKGMSKSFLDRLTLNDKRIRNMSDSLLEIAKLNDPTGELIRAWRRPNGLWIYKVRTSIGVIAIIYESRPNVTSDCIGLCFKTGNSVILRGGSEALNSNLCIYRLLKEVLQEHGIPEGAINLVATKDRRAVDILLKLDNYVDLVIPRGGEGLINRVTKISRIPLLKHYKGICHVYVDEWADLNMAEDICFNAKVQRPGVCNAMESMLVHKHVAGRFLPGMLKRFKNAGVEIRGCNDSRKIIDKISPALARKGWIKKATDRDYHTEYLGLTLSLKLVENIDEAIKHINHYGTRHSESIITDNYQRALMFLRQVDAACVYVNASTRFTDGYQFGLGAEIGISTDKLHARGPVALEELTTYKYMVFGSGQIRS